MRPLDKTTQTYVEKDNAALTRFLREIKDGLCKLNPLELTMTRDGKGGKIVSGARRASKLYYQSAFDDEFLGYHARAIYHLQFMEERGWLLDPNAKTSNPERVSGSGFNDAISERDKIAKVYNAWKRLCEDKRRNVSAATIQVFGKGNNFVQASRAMREDGLKATDKTVKGLAILGIELYTNHLKKVDRESE